MSDSLRAGAPAVNPLTQKCGLEVLIQDSILVTETHDEDGDLEYVLWVRTHSRRALDQLADLFEVDLEFQRPEVHDAADND